jgi:hypothetical protein
MAIYSFVFRRRGGGEADVDLLWGKVWYLACGGLQVWEASCASFCIRGSMLDTRGKLTTAGAFVVPGMHWRRVGLGDTCDFRHLSHCHHARCWWLQGSFQSSRALSQATEVNQTHTSPIRLSLSYMLLEPTHPSVLPHHSPILHPTPLTPSPST